MITWCHGDILQDSAEAIVIPVNTIGVLGAGLARQFRTQFPKEAESYYSLCRGRHLKNRLPINTPSGRFILFPTKVHWIDKSKLQDIEEGLHNLTTTNADRVEYASIAFPKLGAGLGGLDWNDVRPLLVTFADRFGGETRIYGSP